MDQQFLKGYLYGPPSSAGGHLRWLEQDNQRRLEQMRRAQAENQRRVEQYNRANQDNFALKPHADSLYSASEPYTYQPPKSYKETLRDKGIEEGSSLWNWELANHYICMLVTVLAIPVAVILLLLPLPFLVCVALWVGSLVGATVGLALISPEKVIAFSERAGRVTMQFLKLIFVGVACALAGGIIGVLFMLVF